MDRRTVLFGSLGLGMAGPFAFQAPGKSVCLMIGVEKYTNSRVSSLQFAAKDVAAVAKVLETKFGFTDVRVLTTDATNEKDKPTSTNVIKAVNQLVQILEPADSLVFYFSGHGIVRDGKTYLATQDADPSDPLLLDRSTVSLELLQSKLKRLKARQVILILDACRNDPDKGKGDRDNKRSALFSKDLVSVAENVSSSSGGSSAILFACSEGERAYEEEEFGHSVFTKFLLDGLNGKASSFSVDDVVAYASDQVRKWARDNGNKQSPDLHKFGTGKLAFGSVEITPKPVDPKVEVAPTAIRLELLGLPAGAKVMIDDVVLSGTVYTDEIAEKTKELEVSISASSFRPYVRRVTLTRGSASTLRVTMEPKATEPVGPVKPVVKNRLTDYPALKAYVESLRSIPSGSLQMGSTTGHQNEQPVHRVSLTSFRMASTPVTVALWKEYCLSTSLTMHKPPVWSWIDNHPITNVNYHDILGTDGKGGFCGWASRVSGIMLTLPTEAQWEYAAVGGKSGRLFPWGNEFDRTKLWCSSQKSHDARMTAAVDRNEYIHSNEYGLSDMVGNVSQWCMDWYGLYVSVAQVNPINNNKSTNEWLRDTRCVRGCGWTEFEPRGFRVTSRTFCEYYASNFAYGFRVVAN